jgi:UDP-2-acetamido-3-amino-2,3-dideoxy-glucuronate N-acetyltransferase
MASRQPPRTDGNEGLRVLKVLNLCQASLEQEKKMMLDVEAPVTTYFKHATAEVDQNVSIGRETKIWNFSHILTGTTIGRQCIVGQNVVTGPNVTIGNGCKIQNNVSIYEGVTLGDNVFCGPSMVFTNVINPRCAVPRKNEFKQTIVRDGVTFGANCTILCGIEVGAHAFIGAGAVITHDVAPFALMVGNPARHIGWMSRFGKRLDLPLSGSGSCTCPHTGDEYELENDVCRLVNGKDSFLTNM